MPGATLLVLDDHLGAGRVLGEVGGDLAAAVADHHDQLGGIEVPSGGQHIIEHAPPAKRMQHPPELGFHPSFRAPGKDDNSGPTAHRSVAVLLGWLLPGWPGPTAVSVTTVTRRGREEFTCPTLAGYRQAARWVVRKQQHDRRHITVRDQARRLRRDWRHTIRNPIRKLG